MMWLRMCNKRAIKNAIQCGGYVYRDSVGATYKGKGTSRKGRHKTKNEAYVGFVTLIVCSILVLSPLLVIVLSM